MAEKEWKDEWRNNASDRSKHRRIGEEGGCYGMYRVPLPPEVFLAVFSVDFLVVFALGMMVGLWTEVWSKGWVLRAVVGRCCWERGKWWVGVRAGSL
jgi:hypothetical protein